MHQSLTLHFAVVPCVDLLANAFRLVELFAKNQGPSRVGVAGLAAFHHSRIFDAALFYT